MNSVVFWVAATALLLIPVVLLVALLFGLRRSREVAPTVKALANPEVANRVANEIELFGGQRRPHPELDRITPTLELDDLFKQVLRIASVLPRVDAAIVALWEEEAPPLVATLGLTNREASSQPLWSLRNGNLARGMTFRYAFEEEYDDDDPISGGVAVPLAGGNGDALGLLAVMWRGVRRDFSDEEFGRLEDLAARAVPVIENARRFYEARAMAEIDPLTSLYNHRHFHETVAREVSRAQRYSRDLALVLLDIDDFKDINDEVGHLAGDDVLAGFAERVRAVTRGTDIACRIGGDEFAIILPESRLADAESLCRRLQAAVFQYPIGPAKQLLFSAGITSVTEDDNEVTLFERADRALYRAKEAGKGQAVSDGER